MTGVSKSMQKRLSALHKRDRIALMKTVERQLGTLILATPTSEARNLLTEANLALMQAADKPEFKE